MFEVRNQGFEFVWGLDIRIQDFSAKEEYFMEDETQETGNTAPAAEDLEAIRLQLQEEQEARAAARSSLEEKEKRIAELEASLREARQGSEASAAELARVEVARDQAVAKYLDMARALNPTIPEGIIAGETIEEIDASVDKGKAIVEAVKEAVEAEAREAKVPAGAPTRGSINLEGLSAREKIALGIQQKGGAS
jgi:chromosome segregation ATPase